MRLVQLRDFLGGRGWIKKKKPRLGTPVCYNSHW